MAALVSPPELQYITDALLAGNRSDGRSFLQFRDIHLATNVIAQTAGSARASCAGTDVLVGIKLETGSTDSDERLQATVELSQNALQSLPEDPTLTLTAHAYDMLSFLANHPQLSIIRNSRCWHLHLHVDVLASSGGGNLHDIVGIAIRSALSDLRIPRTRSVAFATKKAHGGATGDGSDGEDVGMKALLKGKKGSAQKTSQASAPDFELLDYEADTGEHLRDREELPVSVTLYLTPNTHQAFLDATLFESYAAPTRLVYVFEGTGSEKLRAVRQEIPEGCATSAPNEVPFNRVNDLIDTAGDIAKGLCANLNERFKDSSVSQGGIRLAAFT